MFSYLKEIFTNYGFMPHIHCYLGRDSIVWTMVITDILIGLAYVSISLTLWFLVRRIKISFSVVVFCFGVFIAACGATHFMEVYTLWIPDYWSSAFMKIITAVASVGTAVYLYRFRHAFFSIAEAAKLSEVRREELETLNKSLEIRVEERTTELQKAITVRDDFFSIAAHELRTPLTSLKLRAQMAKRRIEKKIESDSSFKFVNEVNEQIDRLTRLVEDMLDITRFKAGALSLNIEQENIALIAKAAFQRLIFQLKEKNIDASLDLDNMAIADVDGLRIDQVITNLLSNAIKYAPNVKLLLSVKSIGANVIIKVRDEGPGIAIEHQKMIFQRFERVSTDRNVSGLGVGLFLCKSIIESHQGTLVVISNPGQGAEFIATVPIKNPIKNFESTMELSDT